MLQEVQAIDFIETQVESFQVRQARETGKIGYLILCQMQLNKRYRQTINLADLIAWKI